MIKTVSLSLFQWAQVQARIVDESLSIVQACQSLMVGVQASIDTVPQVEALLAARTEMVKEKLARLDLANRVRTVLDTSLETALVDCKINVLDLHSRIYHKQLESYTALLDAMPDSRSLGWSELDNLKASIRGKMGDSALAERERIRATLVTLQPVGKGDYPKLVDAVRILRNKVDELAGTRCQLMVMNSLSIEFDDDLKPLLDDYGIGQVASDLSGPVPSEAGE